MFAIDVLDEIEIFDIADDKITKGEYMIYLINLFAKYDETYEGDSLYSDVVERDECYEAANIAKQMGCYPGLELKPRENIAYGEAVEEDIP